MLEFSQSRINATLKYNPHIWGDDELHAMFVARRRELEQLLNALKNTEFTELAQHLLITGYRGMGKSTLLRRLDLAIRSDADLSEKWLPLLFPAGHYKVNSLADFWSGTLDLLQVALEKKSWVLDAKLDKAIENLQYLEGEEFENLAVQILEDWSAMNNCQIVLLVDGTDQLLENVVGGKQKNTADKSKNVGNNSKSIEDNSKTKGNDSPLWRLRSVLSKCTNLFWIGSSYIALESDYSYADAFHDFFNPLELEPLDIGEMRNALVDLAGTLGDCQEQNKEQSLRIRMEQCLRSQPERLKLLHSISNGNLRSMVIICDLLLANHVNDFRSDLKVLVDTMTPIYQGRIEQLSTQAQKVLAHLMESWAPISSGELSDKAKLPRTTVSANLSRLEREGLIQKINRPDSKRSAYQVNDRLFNMWYLLTIHTPRALLDDISWLMEFMRLWYSESRLEYLGSQGNSSLMGLIFATKNLYPELEVMSLSKPEADKLGIEVAKRLSIGNSYYELGDYSDAISSYEKALDIEAKLPEAWNNLANVYIVHLHDYNKAEEAYNKAIAIDQNLSTLWNSLGRFLQDSLQRYEESEALYLRALDIDPNLAIAWSNLGDLFQSYLQRYDEAETAYRKAIDADPRSAVAWNNLGNLLQNHFQRYKESEVAYRKAIEFNPNLAAPWSNLGYLLSKHYKRYKDAEEAYLKALELDPSIAEPPTTLGVSEQDDSELYQRAEKHQVEEADSDIKYIFSLSAKARALILDNKVTAARKHYRELIDLVAKKDMTDEFACLLLQANLYLGNSDSALQALEFLAEKIAANGEALTLYNLSVQVGECQLLGKGEELAKLLKQSQYGNFLKPIRLALLAINGDDAERQKAPEEVQKMAEAVEEELVKQIAAINVRESDVGHTA